ncbi:hypothetical protein P154DRAFT_179204 [Amniculicola lignicola CBS 123094]|uniref:Uncharacterized protein n=1 Tax=Amniculicola lignicola CBS 123094 TaxID=1392246 RepID=A0A6A5X0V5_9PLEO|nr:hypothetical protein P154DRAFT_179204 [Amniculicola lignicola CBS 123094]
MIYLVQALVLPHGIPRDDDLAGAYPALEESASMGSTLRCCRYPSNHDHQSQPYISNHAFCGKIWHAPSTTTGNFVLLAGRAVAARLALWQHATKSPWLASGGRVRVVPGG